MGLKGEQTERLLDERRDSERDNEFPGVSLRSAYHASLEGELQQICNSAVSQSFDTNKLQSLQACFEAQQEGSQIRPNELSKDALELAAGSTERLAVWRIELTVNQGRVAV